MRKKVILIGVLCSAFILLWSRICIADNGIVYTQCCVSQLDMDEIKRTRIPTTQNLLKNLTFNGIDLSFDQEGNRWFYSLVEGQECAFEPNVQYIGYNQNVRIAILEQKISTELIEKNGHVMMIAYDDKQYHEYAIVYTTLPIMELSYAGDTLYRDNIDCKIRLVDNGKDALNRIVQSDGYVRIRGASTSLYEKKGLRLSLITRSAGNHARKNMQSLLGMRQDDDWILYAAYNDQEKVRNVFSTNLWNVSSSQQNDFSVKNGNEYKFLELFINENYYGLYALGYPIDDKQLEIGEGEVIIKNVDWGKELTEDVTDFSGYEVSSNIADEQFAWDLFTEYRMRMNTAIAECDKDEIYRMTDMDNMVDMYLFWELIQAPDTISGSRRSNKNMYISFKKNEYDEWSVMHTPWDMDIAWGNKWKREEKNFTLNYFIPNNYTFIWKGNAIGALLEMGDEQIAERVIERYKELRNTTWSDEAICLMLDELEMDIYGSGAYLREQERWPDGTYSESKGLSVFKEYVLERLKVCDTSNDLRQKLVEQHIYDMFLVDQSFNLYIKIGEQYSESRECKDLLKILGVDDVLEEDIENIFISRDTNQISYNVDIQMITQKVDEEENLDNNFGLQVYVLNRLVDEIMQKMEY